MSVLFANNASSRIPSDLPAGSTSIPVMAGEGARFPAVTAGNHFMVTLEDRRTGQIEICRCTARSGDILTVTRAQEGTTAQTFLLGTTVSNRLTAGTIIDFTGVPEAPIDGKIYGRKDLTWLESIAKTTFDAEVTRQNGINNSQNNAITNLQNDVSVITGDNDTQDIRLDAIEAKNNQQDGRLSGVEADNDVQDAAITGLYDRMDANDALDSTQDGRLTNVESKNTTQDGRLTAVENKNTEQDGRLTAVEAKNTTQDAAIAANTGSISTINTEQDAQDAAIADLDATKLDDGPHDGFVYGRKDGTWSTVIGGASTDAEPPPAPLQNGQLWWESDTGKFYVYYNDGNTSQWVQAAGKGPKGDKGDPGAPGDPATVQEPYPFATADMQLKSLGATTISLNTKADGTGSDMLMFHDDGRIGFKGTGTTPRDYTIQSINGVLLVQGTAGSNVQLSHGLVVGTGLSVTGGGISASGAISAGSFSTSGSMTLTGGITADGQIKTTSNVVTSLGLYALADTTFGMFVSGATRYLTVISTSYCFNCNGANGDMSWMQPGGYNWFARASDAAFIIRGQAYKPGGGAWIDASDSRIKNILGNYDNGLDAILALQPVRYTFKGNDSNGPPEHKPEDPVMDEETGAMITPESKQKSVPIAPYWNSPHNLHAAQGTEFIGLIAQDTEGPMPELVNKVTGWIDGVEVTDLRNLDTAPLVFALINAVKTMAARIEELEAKVGV